MIDSKKGTDAIYSSHNFNSVSYRRSTGVALQYRLGLLSERRAGPRLADSVVRRSASVSKCWLLSGNAWLSKDA